MKLKKFKVGEDILIKATVDLKEYRSTNVITTSMKAVHEGQKANYYGYHDKQHIKAKLRDNDGKYWIVIVPLKYLL